MNQFRQIKPQPLGLLSSLGLMKPAHPSIQETLPGEPRPGIDVTTFPGPDGSIWIQGVPARRPRPPGLSFLQLDDESSVFVHKSYSGPCMLVTPGTSLLPGFEMICMETFRWSPKQRRGQVRLASSDPSFINVGKHYHLVPRIDMPLSVFTGEVMRIASTPCTALSPATFENSLIDASTWPYPMDSYLILVVDALLAASRGGPSLQLNAMDCALAYLYAASICSEDPDLDMDMFLEDPVFLRLSLIAIDQYQPEELDRNILVTMASNLSNLHMVLLQASRCLNKALGPDSDALNYDARLPQADGT